MHFARFLLLALLFTSLIYSADFGARKMAIERVWTISGESGTEFTFTGSIGVNNSNQRLYSLTTDPGVEIIYGNDGSIKLNYTGEFETTRTIQATAIFDIYYSTNITSDSQLTAKSLSFTNLTQPSEDMVAQANQIADRSSVLATIKNLTNWVNGYVDYDLSRWGKVDAAQQVFTSRKGVCVEYSHLLISMLRSLGFETRYVSGYVYSTSWQPHAWVEVYLDNYGWMPVDPTFGQAGVLDSSHVAIYYGEDHATSYDQVLSTDASARLSVNDSVWENSKSERLKDVIMGLAFDNKSLTLSSSLSNPSDKFVLGTSELILPQGYPMDKSQILLLAPGQKIESSFTFDRSKFSEGFAYTLPVALYFNGVKEQKELKIIIPAQTLVPPSTPKEGLESCPLSAAFVLLTAFFVLNKR